jgi:hypothetical protein
MNMQKCKYTMKRLFSEATLHGINQYKCKDMNRQKCKYTKKQLSGEAMLPGIAEARTCTGAVALTHISPAVYTYCRMAMRICFKDETKKCTAKSVMKRICKSIIIHL